MKKKVSKFLYFEFGIWKSLPSYLFLEVLSLKLSADPSNPATKILSLESDNLIGMLGISENNMIPDT